MSISEWVYIACAVAFAACIAVDFFVLHPRREACIESNKQVIAALERAEVSRQRLIKLLEADDDN